MSVVLNRLLAKQARLRTVLVVVVLLCIFAMPWIVPTQVDVIRSDSQVVGFNNRIAMVALAAGVLALFWTARRDPGPDAAPLISVRTAPRGEQVSGRLVGASVAVTFLVVAALASILQTHPFGDAAYFMDRLLRIVAGGSAYSQIEFSYGPLLIYDLLTTWRLLSWTGLSIYTAYYGWVAIGYAGGLFVTAYVLNRIRLRRRVRNALFAGVAGITLLMPTLGVNYSALRFLLPYAAFLWVLDRITGSPRRILASALPLIAVVFVAGVSPEMGMALMVALVVALSSMASKRDGLAVRGLVVLVAGTAMLAAAAAAAGSGTFASFAGGAYYLPILPGAPALAYVGTMLLLAWGLGTRSDSSKTMESAVNMGWLGMAVVLIAPALGRADFGHVLWNGLGAFLVCAAVVERTWRRAGAYLGGIGAVFVSSMLLYTLVFFVPLLADAGSRALLASPKATVLAVRLLGRSPASYLRKGEEQRAASVEERRVATRLAEETDLCYLGFLEGELGTTLAASARLAPLYTAPKGALSAADFERVAEQIGSARSVALPTSDLEACKSAAAAHAQPGGDHLVMSIPAPVDPSRYGILLGLPVRLTPRNAAFNATASLGVLLGRDWKTYETVGAYTILRKR